MESSNQSDHAVGSDLQQPDVDHGSTDLEWKMAESADEGEVPDCSHFIFVVYVGVFGAICVFGLVGNSLSWAVLKWERRGRGRVATFLLQMMAVVDNLFLLTAGVSQITMALKVYSFSLISSPENTLIGENISTPFNVGPASSLGHAYNASCSLSGYNATGFALTDLQNGLVGGATNISGSQVSGGIRRYMTHGGGVICTSPAPHTTAPPLTDNELSSTGSLFAFVMVHVTAYVAVLVFPFVHVTQMWTVWITVLVAVNRYVAICRPFEVSRLCTMKQTMRQLGAMGLAIFVYCLPRFFEYQIVYEPEPVRVFSLTTRHQGHSSQGE